MRQKYLILLACMILITMVFFYFSSKIIQDKSGTITRYDKKIKVEQEKLNSAKVLNEQLKHVSQVILNSMTNEKTFDSEEVNKFSKKLADTADKHKIAIHSFYPKVISTYSSKLLEQQYTMELNCTFVQLGQFLSDLERFDYIIKIKTIDVQPERKDTKTMQEEDLITRYRVTLELSTFKIVKEA